MSAQCPQCKAQVTLTGKIYTQIDYINPPAYFRPSSLPFYAVFKSNVQFMRFVSPFFHALAKLSKPVAENYKTQAHRKHQTHH